MSTVAPDAIADQVRLDGFSIVRGVLPKATLDALVREFEQSDRDAAIQRAGAVYGERNLLDADGLVVEVCRSQALRSLAERVLGLRAVAVRGLFFDKVPGANWNLTWHQDVTIAVKEKRDTAGFGPWSVKAGVTHVHASVEVLQAMVAVRIHLDDCPADNGALEVLPGTHRLGKLPTTEVSRLAAERDGVICAAPRGSALLMAPLLIHASRASARPAHRLVLHVEYATVDLPGGLEWKWSIGANPRPVQ